MQPLATLAANPTISKNNTPGESNKTLKERKTKKTQNPIQLFSVSPLPWEIGRIYCAQNKLVAVDAFVKTVKTQSAEENRWLKEILTEAKPIIIHTTEISPQIEPNLMKTVRTVDSYFSGKDRQRLREVSTDATSIIIQKIEISPVRKPNIVKADTTVCSEVESAYHLEENDEYFYNLIGLVNNLNQSIKARYQ